MKEGQKKVKNSCIKSGKKGLATGVASINNLFITEDSKRFENMVKEIELMR